MGLKTRLVKGKPVTTGEKTLQPVARTVNWNWRRAAVRQDGIHGFGATAAWLQPVAVLEETAGGLRRIPVHDKTSQTILVLLTLALVLPLALNWLARCICAISNSPGNFER